MLAGPYVGVVGAALHVCWEQEGALSGLGPVWVYRKQIICQQWGW
jgi:hypothetical protein